MTAVKTALLCETASLSSPFIPGRLYSYRTNARGDYVEVQSETGSKGNSVILPVAVLEGQVFGSFAFRLVFDTREPT